MMIARWISSGPAVAGLLISLTPFQAWADGGAGIRFKTPTIIYSDDEDEDEDDGVETLEATPDPTFSAYSAPENFGLSVRANYGFRNKLEFRLEYRGEEGSEEPASLTVNNPDPALNFRADIGMRIDWRFPRYEYSDTADDEEKDEPAFTPSLPTIKYRFSTWTSFDALEAIEDDPLKGLDPDKYAWDEDEGLGLRVGGSIIKLDISPEGARNFEDALTSEYTRARVANWLGDEAFEKFQTQFGPAADDAGAEDFSGWAGYKIYCGATCVGRYY